MNALQIVLPIADIQDYCRTKPIARLSVFGSVLRDDFTDQSDVDLLVEYLPDAHTSFFDIAQQEIDLTELVGRKIDLRTPQELSRYFRDEVIRAVQVIYERT